MVLMLVGCATNESSAHVVTSVSVNALSSMLLHIPPTQEHCNLLHTNLKALPDLQASSSLNTDPSADFM
jgi:hypothetical protein